MRAASFLLWAVLITTVQAAAAPPDDRPFRAVINGNGVQRVEMIGGGYFFFPNRIIVKRNVPVELVVRKEPGIVPHDIVMDSPETGIKFHETLEDTPKVIRFTPTTVGTYPFFCSKKLPFFASHREKGMEGELEVVE